MDLTIEDEEKLNISFANIKETYKMIATIENGELIKTDFQGDKIVAQEIFLECLDRSFNNLPDWLRWGCYIACGAI